jgi:hypothetical protein
MMHEQTFMNHELILSLGLEKGYYGKQMSNTEPILSLGLEKGLKS